MSGFKGRTCNVHEGRVAGAAELWRNEASGHKGGDLSAALPGRHLRPSKTVERSISICLDLGQKAGKAGKELEW